MAALLLSRKKLPKLIRNNIKFTKSYSSTISKVIINGPQLNLGWRHCAVAINHRVIFYFPNILVWLFFWISRTFFLKVCCSTLFCFRSRIIPQNPMRLLGQTRRKMCWQPCWQTNQKLEKYLLVSGKIHIYLTEKPTNIRISEIYLIKIIAEVVGAVSVT